MFRSSIFLFVAFLPVGCFVAFLPVGHFLLPHFFNLRQPNRFVSIRSRKLV